MISRSMQKILEVLVRSGALKLRGREVFEVVKLWWQYGNSYACLASIAAMRFPRACALSDQSGILSFEEVWTQSQSLAAELHKTYGLTGDKQAAILCRNNRCFVIALIALSLLGVDILPLNPTSPKRVLDNVFRRQSVDVVLYEQDLEASLDQAAPGVRRHCLSQSSGIGSLAIEKLPRAERTSQLVVLTSGSTGIPKGIRRRPTVNAMLSVFSALLEGMPISMHRPAILAIPLFHGYGLATLAMTLSMTAPLHMANSLEIAPLLERISADAGAILVSVPTLLRRWMKEPVTPERNRLAAVITGSAPLDAQLCDQLMESVGPILFNLYGSTEAGVLCMASPEALIDAPGTVGVPLGETRLRITGAQGESIAQGKVGHINVSGPLVLKPGPDGWFDTGDLGYLDECDRLFVVGRKDSMFVSGGENVYPEITECLIVSHPHLLDAAVVVVDDDEFGKSMVACVVARPGKTVNKDSLRNWLREHLERHQLPRRIELVAAIPRSALGKIDKDSLVSLVGVN